MFPVQKHQRKFVTKFFYDRLLFLEATCQKKKAYAKMSFFSAVYPLMKIFKKVLKLSAGITNI